MKKAFLICPVRGHDRSESEGAVRALEADGYKVHWPPRDTKQGGDPKGYRICRDNRAAIEAADVIFIIWDGKSKGCLFDAGMAFMANKPIVCLTLPKATLGKSFQNMMREWERRSPSA